MRVRPQISRRRRLPPKPPEPPPGYMWFYWELVPVEQVRREARRQMARFDRLPRSKRDRLNYEG
jgi:hypothetical protein